MGGWSVAIVERPVLRRWHAAAAGVWMLAALTTAAAAEPSRLGLPPLPVPADNPLTAAKIALGARLFRDQRLSTTGEVSCNTCHLSGVAFQDARVVPRGVHQRKGTRNAPTVLNAAYLSALFWDGRAATLEEQALLPLTNPVEQGFHSLDAALQRIAADPAYRQAFEAVFSERPALTATHLARALAAFERTLVAGGSPFDRWHFGGDESAVDAAVKRGWAVFSGPAGCTGCHPVEAQSALFTDQAYHALGVGFARLGPDPRAVAQDPAQAIQAGAAVVSELGRYAVTGRLDDLGAFRTPTLRNVARTAPYFHDGSAATLEAVIAFFDAGGRQPGADAAAPYRSPRLRPLGLGQQQKDDLVAFLRSLSSPDPAIPPP